LKATMREVDRVFGHLRLEVYMDEGGARARFSVTQEPRFFEKILVGRRFDEVPFIASRICGACSVAHFLASIYAIEDAMGVEVPEDVLLLRDLANQLQTAQNHVVHLVFMALPDYMGFSNLDEMLENASPLVKEGVRLNSLCVQAAKLLAGRIINPTVGGVGGFHLDLDPYRIDKAVNLLKEAEKLAEDLADAVLKLHLPELEERTSNYAVLDAPRGYLTKGDIIKLSSGAEIKAREYTNIFTEVTTEGSTSKLVTVGGSPLYVGPRARLNAYRDLIKELKHYLEPLPHRMRNPFYNVKAKALEILYTVKNVRRVLEELRGRSLKLRTEVRVRGGEGVGVIEAPRGLLIHHYRVDDDGRLVYANIITPTVFNARHTEESVEQLAASMLRSGEMNDEKLGRLAEMLVRSYDPCLPCATHVVLYRGVRR